MFVSVGNNLILDYSSYSQRTRAHTQIRTCVVRRINKYFYGEKKISRRFNQYNLKRLNEIALYYCIVF